MGCFELTNGISIAKSETVLLASIPGEEVEKAIAGIVSVIVPHEPKPQKRCLPGDHHMAYSRIL